MLGLMTVDITRQVSNQANAIDDGIAAATDR
jgi:hypothetical protein